MALQPAKAWFLTELAKRVGLVDVLREHLRPMQGRINLAFVFGSLAAGTGTAQSDVDLMVVGDMGLA
jgi:predicted nucleotidyltransferase